MDDRTPLRHQNACCGGSACGRRSDRPLAEPASAPGVGTPASGRHAVQVLRTYPAKRPPTLRPRGERSIARIYRKPSPRALTHLRGGSVFWSEDIASLYEETLRRAPGLRMIVVVPVTPIMTGPSGPANRLGQLAMRNVHRRRR